MSSNPFSALDSDSEAESRPVAKTTQKKKTTSRKPVQPRLQPNSNRENAGRKPAPKNAAKKGDRPRGGRDREGHTHGRNPGAQAKKGKREYERRSGTGRGREVKKDGAGSRNWGKAGDESKPVEGEKAEKKEEEGEKVEEEPVEPETPTLTMEEFEAMRLAKRQGELFQKKEVRVVEEDIAGKAYAKTGDVDSVRFLQMGEKKEKKTRGRKEGKEVFTDVSFKVENSVLAAQAGAGEYGDRRGGRGGRGRGGRGSRDRRSGRSSQPKSAGAAVNTGDLAAFPALGGN